MANNEFLEFINNETVLNADNLNKLAQIKNPNGELLHQITMTDNPAEGGNNKIASAEAVKKLNDSVKALCDSTSVLDESTRALDESVKTLDIKKLNANMAAVDSAKFNGKTEGEFINAVLAEANPKIFGFFIDEHDDLIMNFVGDEEPDVSIDEDGYLIYKY